ncbi:hypothetical protein GGD56_000153 [Rhizobium mongolense]|uniref:Uncharacterized protein n=1 Tax=Rhizobium mongolense TaxID=57676 RepID=A0ABR6IEP7_9HYPH|nr:hypothetical protein [Rhizobium mongolense]
MGIVQIAVFAGIEPMPCAIAFKRAYKGDVAVVVADDRRCFDRY